MYNYKGISITPNEAYVLLTIENSELEKRLEKQLKQCNMEKHQFKPFEKVLVRDHENDTWSCGIYSHYANGHMCTDTAWKQCIPYAGNERLLNTNKPYTPPQPKTFSVSWTTFDGPNRVEYTDEEFEHFIKIAVLRNKDIQNFNVRKI